MLLWKVLITCVIVIGIKDVNASFDIDSSSSTEPAILLTDGLKIIRVDIENNNTFSDLTNNSATSGIDYHYRKNLLVWSKSNDTENNKIYLQSLNTSVIIRTIAVNGSWMPTAVAVDWVGDNIYVADEIGKKVDVFDFDGKWHAVLLASNLSRPSDIALDPTAGVMFVADTDQVVRANMDGTHSETIISRATYTDNPFSVAVDIEAKRIYFAPALLSYIDSSDYNGNHRTTILPSDSLIAPVRLAVFKNTLFWTDDFRHKAFSFNNDLQSNMSEIYAGEVTPEVKYFKALSIVHPERQVPIENPCGSDNGGCEQLCIVTAINEQLGFRCACQVGFTLNRDFKSCDLIDEFLIYSQHSTVQGVGLDPAVENYNNIIMIDVAPSMIFISLDFDYEEEQIYYTEILDNRIYRINKNGTNKEMLLSASEQIGEVKLEHLALDWISKNLYFVQSRRGTIDVLNVKNVTHTKTLLRDLNKPRAVAVHPNRGYIFFSEWGRQPGISRAKTNGKDVLKFENVTVGWPNGLAVDYEEDRIYWCDAQLHQVQHANLDGQGIVTITSKFIKHPFSIVIHKEFMYLTDWKSNGLYRYNKNGGDEHLMVERHPSKGLYGVKVYSKDAQRAEDDPCAKQGCSEFCFAISQEGSNVLIGRCECSEGRVLASDGISCLSP
ncbi:unnamed protein product [Leptosia nina]|uniref:EGF-like domain-containing protein n=1 Tax=Leptosia nina TaxID=320188 RepID=A0AAV1J5T3_9NEOP